MASAAVSVSRELHLSMSDGKHRVRVWGGHVGLFRGDLTASKASDYMRIAILPDNP